MPARHDLNFPNDVPSGALRSRAHSPPPSPPTALREPGDHRAPPMTSPTSNFSPTEGSQVGAPTAHSRPSGCLGCLADTTSAAVWSPFLPAALSLPTALPCAPATNLQSSGGLLPCPPRKPHPVSYDLRIYTTPQAPQIHSFGVQ